MLVAGLVEADAFGGRSRAIPATIVKLAVLAVLAVLVFWPFLKLMLLGGTQRIRALDVLQLGVSCVAAPGLLTIALLDFYADRRLQQDQDRDLASLAVSIDESFTAEIAAAAEQLACLEDVTREAVPRTGAERDKDAIGNALALNIRRSGPSSCEGGLEPAPGLSGGDATPPSTRWPHPYFESFSLIGPDGMQRLKIATTRWVSSRISVRERRYFKDVQSKALWKDARFCPNGTGCSLESVMSWTTGDAQAVLATAASNPCRDGKEPCKDPDFAVAALSMTLRSLAQPILPPGYEFAVIDDNGTVFFHSDPQRNGYENFFEETDGNRRLRAQVLANSTAPLDLRYWGAPYRGYVRPLAPFGLTLVTLLQQEQTWALNREWLVVAVLFFGGYMLICALALLMTLASNPSWLWPDAARAGRYPIVIALNLGLFLAALACLRFWGGTTLVWCACLIPLAAWAGTYALLRARSEEVPGTAVEPVHAHRAALILLLVVSGVAPALLMFVASFQLHVQTYVKHGQFRVAQALGQRQERFDVQYNPRRGAQRQTLLKRIDKGTDTYRDLYYDFFYDTCVRDASALSGTSKCPPAPVAKQPGPFAAEPGQGGDDLLALLETYLPYYSESSVEWRELLHSRAGDGSWRSSMSASGVLTTTLPVSSGGTVTLSSSVPRLVGPFRRERVPAPVMRAGAWLGASTTYVLLAGLGLIVIALTRQLVVFVSRHILLTGVTEPLWSRLKVTANAGDNLFVLCDTATRERQVAGAQPLRLGPLARKPHMEAALRQELLRLGRTDRGEALLIDDFDDDLENGALMDRKLTLLERLASDRSRAVVVLSQLSPTALADSVRRLSKTTASTAIAADRWQLLTNAFVITDWRRRAEPGTGVSRPTAEGVRGAPPAPTLMASLPPAVQTLLTAEGKSHPLIGRICERLARSEAVLRGELSDEQLLEEIAEQAVTCYRRLWSACSADERIVLVHIAQDGLTHAGARPAVRKLLARKLLRKAPDLRLMNQTFRLFVLSPACCAEVARLEATNDPSVWDNLRIPLGIAVLGAAAFLVATQRELYEALLGATTAAAVSGTGHRPRRHRPGRATSADRREARMRMDHTRAVSVTTATRRVREPLARCSRARTNACLRR